MKYYSTKDKACARAFSLREAVQAGLAPDGGLFVPERIPQADMAEVERLAGESYAAMAGYLAGLFFGDDFDLDTVRRNFRFYEARTVHESSLSPCVHAILAARIGDLDKAYELYLRTARLDLDDYNREVREGCHVTSMAGSWLSVVEGFGGMRVRDGVLSFDPQLPAAWESLSFKVNFRDRVLTVRITRNAVEVANEGAPVELEIRGVRRLIADKVIMNCEL